MKNSKSDSQPIEEPSQAELEEKKASETYVAQHMVLEKYAEEVEEMQAKEMDRKAGQKPNDPIDNKL